WVADMILFIYKTRGIEAALKWVDDFIFFWYLHFRPNGSIFYAYSKDLIWSITGELGWPWAADKFVPFAEEFTYIGFCWSIRGKTISLPHEKRQKYLKKLDAWGPGSYVLVKDMESLIGTLNHVT
ncbi:hypothetical protein C0993_008474, partial [Termitomyces sp. T159_Od127]